MHHYHSILCIMTYASVEDVLEKIPPLLSIWLTSKDFF
jgi:hypothetical protein